MRAAANTAVRPTIVEQSSPHDGHWKRYLNQSTFDEAAKGSGTLYCGVESLSALAIWSRV